MAALFPVFALSRFRRNDDFLKSPPKLERCLFFPGGMKLVALKENENFSQGNYSIQYWRQLCFSQNLPMSRILCVADFLASHAKHTRRHRGYLERR